MVWLNEGDMLKTKMCLELHIVADFYYWIFIKNIGDLQFALQSVSFKILSSLPLLKFSFTNCTIADIYLFNLSDQSTLIQNLTTFSLFRADSDSCFALLLL